MKRGKTVVVATLDQQLADLASVANERVLFAHEQAFEDRDRFFADLRAALPSVEIIEVPADQVSLADAITSYLFNAQLVTLPDGGGMALILPSEARDNERVWTWLQEMVAGNGPIRRLEVVDVRESMANGGGPACLRLRVVADPATVDRCTKLIWVGHNLERIGDRVTNICERVIYSVKGVVDLPLVTAHKEDQPIGTAHSAD